MCTSLQIYNGRKPKSPKSNAKSLNPKSIGDFPIQCSKQHPTGFKRVLCVPLCLDSSFVVLPSQFCKDGRPLVRQRVEAALAHEAYFSLEAAGKKKLRNHFRY